MARSKSPQDGDNQSSSANLSLANLSLQITVAFSLFAAITFLVRQPGLDVVFAIVSAILFFVGAGVLGLGFWNGIQRSKVDEVRIAGLLAVDKSFVSAKARNRLWLAILIQIVVTFGFAAGRPFTQQAFGVLVPTLGLGFAALWGSRFAKFHLRKDRR